MFDYVKIHKIIRNFQMDENKLKFTEISFELLVIFFTFVYVSVFFLYKKVHWKFVIILRKDLMFPMQT